MRDFIEAPKRFRLSAAPTVDAPSLRGEDVDKGDDLYVVALVAGSRWAVVERDAAEPGDRRYAFLYPPQDLADQLRDGAEPDDAAPPPEEDAIVEPDPPPPSHKPGEPFRDCESCPLMTTIARGGFWMGSPPWEAGRKSDEGPRRWVEIERSFAIGVCEVSNAEWIACVGERGCAG